MRFQDRIQAADLDIQPVERASTIPSEWYVDEWFHEFDDRQIFGSTWQCVGHVSQVQTSGQFLVADVGKHPILVVRDELGSLRGFHNVCRHRAGPLALQDGCAKVLQCKYHGWTYRLDGSLRGVPRFDRVELFDKRDFGLVPIVVDEWEGMIFVNLDRDAESLGGVMGGIRERVRPTDLSTMKFARRVDYEVDCNWKVYVDNYLEGYHVPFVHPELFKLYDFSQYKTEVGEEYSLQSSPLQTQDNIYAQRGGEALYYFVFPNFMMNILPDRLQTNLVVPLAHNRCRVIFRYYYPEVSTAEAQERIDADVAYSDEVQQEDIAICVEVQRRLGTNVYDRGRFSVDLEEGVWHFQSLLKGRYRRGLERDRPDAGSAAVGI